MTEKIKKYDLEERTEKFARSTINYVKHLPKTLANVEIARQLIRSAGSVGANYIEANESVSKKDFILRIKISRKETKESRYWLRLTEPKDEYKEMRDQLVSESTEVMKIFGAILQKSK